MKINQDAVSPAINIAAVLIYGVQSGIEEAGLQDVLDAPQARVAREGLEHLNSARESLRQFTLLFK